MLCCVNFSLLFDSPFLSVYTHIYTQSIYSEFKCHKAINKVYHVYIYISICFIVHNKIIAVKLVKYFPMCVLLYKHQT